MRKPIIAAAAVIALGCGFSATTLAEPAAEDAAKYRQYIMRALSGHFGALTMTARGLAGDAANLGKHSAALVELGAEIGPAFEAVGVASAEGSEALPAVWEDADGFAAAVEKFASAAAALDAAIAAGDTDAIMSAHRETGASCKGCHEDFRLDD